jgi:hypothetical protein
MPPPASNAPVTSRRILATANTCRSVRLASAPEAAFGSGVRYASRGWLCPVTARAVARRARPLAGDHRRAFAGSIESVDRGMARWGGRPDLRWVGCGSAVSPRRRAARRGALASAARASPLTTTASATEYRSTTSIPAAGCRGSGRPHRAERAHVETVVHLDVVEGVSDDLDLVGRAVVAVEDAGQ